MRNPVYYIAAIILAAMLIGLIVTIATAQPKFVTPSPGHPGYYRPALPV